MSSAITHKVTVELILAEVHNSEAHSHFSSFLFILLKYQKEVLPPDPGMKAM